MQTLVKLLEFTLGREIRQMSASYGSRLGCISPMRRCLDRFLGGIWNRAAVEAALGSGQRNGSDLLCGTIQQHTKTACFSVSAENFVVLEIVGESYWCDLVFCSRLQCIITLVGLPLYAKDVVGLQRSLTVQQLVHNWVRPHWGLSKKTTLLFGSRAIQSICEHGGIAYLERVSFYHVLADQRLKYGHTHYGKPRFRCQTCRRQFALNAT